jgi:hypothetical protein
MNTKRFLKLLFAALLVVAAVFAFQNLYNPGSAMKSSSNYVGIGDLRRYEAARALPKTGVTARSLPYVGMGDLRRYEATRALPKTGVTARSLPYVGMGDLQRYEAARALPKTGVTARSLPYVGMGDLRRYEFEQEERNNK